jgi:hypothetical protein
MTMLDEGPSKAHVDTEGASPNGKGKCPGALEKYSDSVVRKGMVY